MLQSTKPHSSEIAVSQSDRFVYCSNRGYDYIPTSRPILANSIILRSGRGWQGTSRERAAET
jgi:6-phosphogluconolactonase (cycloisomerase 2 family)